MLKLQLNELPEFITHEPQKARTAALDKQRGWLSGPCRVIIALLCARTEMYKTLWWDVCILLTAWPVSFAWWLILHKNSFEVSVHKTSKQRFLPHWTLGAFNSLIKLHVRPLGETYSHFYLVSLCPASVARGCVCPQIHLQINSSMNSCDIRLPGLLSVSCLLS